MLGLGRGGSVLGERWQYAGGRVLCGLRFKPGTS